jgi:hypothetical protein
MMDRYKVAILRGPNLASADILLESASALRIPELEIPKYRRPAQELIYCVRDLYGFETVAMATPHPTPSVDPLQPNDSQPFLYVLECLSTDQPAPTGTRWIPVSSIDGNVGDSPLIASALDQLSNPQGPFAHLGWSRELLEWIRNLGVPVTGEFRQIHGDHLFAVVRFETSKGPAVWFKAVGEPCLAEWCVTPALAIENSDCFPRLVGMKPEWRGWLMEEAPGELLWAREDLEDWRRAVIVLAQLQLRYAGRGEKLLSIGCKDQRLFRLRRNLAPFFEAMVGVMARQQSDRAQRLDRATLMWMAAEANHLLDVAEALRIPDSLTHGDFGPHNVIVDPARITFIDWAEASVGDPFSTLEYLLVWRRKRFPGFAAWDESLRDMYASVWQHVASAEAAHQHARIAPALTALTVCLRGEIEMLQNENRARYMRSVTRALHRQLTALSLGVAA